MYRYKDFLKLFSQQPYPHFINGKTELEKAEKRVQGHLAGKGQSGGSNLDLPRFEPQVTVGFCPSIHSPTLPTLPSQFQALVVPITDFYFIATVEKSTSSEQGWKINMLWQLSSKSLLWPPQLMHCQGLDLPAPKQLSSTPHTSVPPLPRLGSTSCSISEARCGLMGLTFLVKS